MDEKLFRKKTIERINSPEKLDDFLQVARPKVWIIMSAIIILIIGAAVWAAFGVVEIRDANGEPIQVHPIEFVIN